MSYYRLLGLEKEPFSTTPDPAFFYRSVTHDTALKRLEIAVRLKRGLSIILGDVGTGKTTLWRTLVQSFKEEDSYFFHVILDPSQKSEFQFLSSLIQMFGLQPYIKSTLDYRQAIEQYLFQKGVEENKTIVLLIDEGQKLSSQNLETLRTLLNYETNEFKLLQIVILAQLELLTRINRLKNFNDRVSFRYVINPLGFNETKEMINFRLTQSGYKPSDGKWIFSEEAIKAIYEFTNGYPRKVSHICHDCLEYIVMHQKHLVDLTIIKEIINLEENGHKTKLKP